MTYRSIISFILPVILVLFIGFQWSKAKTQKNTSTSNLAQKYDYNNKQKGVHFFGRLDSINFEKLKENNIEWLTLVSWGMQKDVDSPIISHHNGDSLMIRQRDSSWISRIEKARAAGFKVFLKPHVWLQTPSDGKWRSDIFPTNAENWKTWQKCYRDFIIRYAKIAEQTQAELFCVGMEFHRLSVEKPLFWKNLIQEVRAVYSGEITYAANWYQEYEQVTFWNDLDYIGIQAYFPLVPNENPSVEELSKGWNEILPTINAVHKKYNRPILFTEVGYKSTTDSAVEPWLWIEKYADSRFSISLETQANCYQAFFNTIWQKKWFAGVHFWQMKDYSNSGGSKSKDFTPQGKPAEEIIRKRFSRF